jgi:hypothetical protein
MRNSNRPAWLIQDVLREIRKKKKCRKCAEDKLLKSTRLRRKKGKNLIRNAKKEI